MREVRDDEFYDDLEIDKALEVEEPKADPTSQSVKMIEKQVDMFDKTLDIFSDQADALRDLAIELQAGLNDLRERVKALHESAQQGRENE